MKSTIKKLPNSQAELMIEVSIEEMRPLLKLAAQKIAKEAKFDGFRKGKAPYEVVKQKVGEMGILQEALDSIISKTYLDALQEQKIVAIGQPKVEVEKLAPGNALVYKATVPTLPEVKVGDWTKIKLSSKKVEVKDEQVEKVIADILKMRAKEKAVKRAAKKGDRLDIDFDIYLDKVPIENGAQKKYPITIGEGRFIPGFEEELTGMKEGETKEFKLKFPEKYHAKNLAGKEAEFKVKCLQVFEVELPEMNDNFASELSGGQFKTVDELKKNIKENIIKEEQAKEDQRLEIEMLDKIAEISEFSDELPEVLIENEVHKLMHEIESGISQQGLKFEDYLKSLKKTREEFEKEMRPQAIKRAKTAVIAREIYHSQGIKVTDEDIKKETDNMLKAYSDNKDAKKQFESPQYQEYLKNMIGNRKVIEFLKKEIVT